MAAEDWICDLWGDDDDETPEIGVRCKFCAARNLAWEEARDEHNRKRWILVTPTGKIHDCLALAERKVLAMFSDV